MFGQVLFNWTRRCYRSHSSFLKFTVRLVIWLKQLLGRYQINLGYLLTRPIKLFVGSTRINVGTEILQVTFQINDFKLLPALPRSISKRTQSKITFLEIVSEQYRGLLFKRFRWQGRLYKINGLYPQVATATRLVLPLILSQVIAFYHSIFIFLVKKKS